MKAQLDHWIAVEVFGMLIDLAIAAYPVRLVWGLQMQTGMKFWVLAGFGIRLPWVYRQHECIKLLVLTSSA